MSAINRVSSIIGKELPLKEISAVLNCPLSTVKTRLYTGLKKLRVELEGVEL